jgi:cell division protein FtsI/penicillin-binding protein 2
LTLLIGFTAFVILLLVKLFSIQVIDGDYYYRIAVRQHGFLRPIPAERGAILDRNGRQLAVTLPAYRVYADPCMIDHPASTACSLASAADMRVGRLTRKLSNRTTRYVLVSPALDIERALEVKRMGLKGVVVEPVGERIRPYGDAALNVIGRFSLYEEPLGGIEKDYDKELRGECGRRRHGRDALGRPVPCVDEVVKMPVDGNSLVLSIDINLQMIAEAALDRAIEEHGAKGGCVVIADPASGDILAMASNPRNENLPVTAALEPGSVFKACTFATALDLGRVDSLDIFDTKGGKIKVPGGWIRDDHPQDHPLSLVEAFALSSNVAAAMIASMIGCEDFYRYMCAFGFGTPTGIEIGGESEGILREPRHWSGRSLATLAMGQEVSVTAVQLTMMYAAIANGGDLMEPRLVKAVIGADGQIKKRYPAKTVRTVIGTRTATEMTELLRAVVQGGTGTFARMDGVHVAGKTGTGQKANDEGYIAGKYNSVFAGFVPADDPRYVCVVVVDEPSGFTHYGGPVCGPAFKEAMEMAFKTGRDPVPTVCTRLARRTESLVPAVDAVVSSASGGAREETKDKNCSTCPAVLGLTLKEAAQVLGAANIAWRATGSGIVRKQVPPPCAAFKGSRICCLELGGGR